MRMTTKIESIPDTIKEKLAAMDKLHDDIKTYCDTLREKTAKIPYGKYKGRWGIILYLSVTYDFGNYQLHAVISPYDLKLRNGEYLSEPADARCFMPLAPVIHTVRVDNPTLKKAKEK